MRKHNMLNGVMFVIRYLVFRRISTSNCYYIAALEVLESQPQPVGYSVTRGMPKGSGPQEAPRLCAGPDLRDQCRPSAPLCGGSRPLGGPADVPAAQQARAPSGFVHSGHALKGLVPSYIFFAFARRRLEGVRKTSTQKKKIPQVPNGTRQ